MKNRILTVLISLTVFAASAYATEKMAIDPAAMLKGDASPATYTMIVSGNGQVETKPGAVFTTGKEDAAMQLPYLISNPKPIVYPRWAVRQGWKGELVLALEIFKNGGVGRYKVMQSTGYQMLDNAAIKSVKTWKFSPAMKDGKAVLTCVQIPILFDLKSE